MSSTKRQTTQIRSFAFWNVNAIRPRLLYNADDITAFLAQNDPDILFMSELRLISHPTSQSTPSTADKKSRDEQLYWNQALSVGVFKDYKVAGLSLHTSKRYAGTGVLVKKELFGLVEGVGYVIPEGKAKTTSSTALSSPSASSSTTTFSSSSSPSSSSSSSSSSKKKSTTLHNFFKPSPTKPSKRPRLNQGPSPHTPEGRVILLELRDYFILHCYVPNNGGNEASFERRRQWDERVLSFFERVKEEGGMKGKDGKIKEVMYCGDLNVTPDYMVDTSHPEWMRRQMVRSGDVGNSGQPGCTPNEEKRFRNLLEKGGLKDVYRFLNPFPRPKGGNLPYVDITAPVFTWRGSPGKESKEIGRYWRKGMRIDLLLASSSMIEGGIDAVQIVGAGEDNKDPTFLGSDHCPV
eukprot:CAMPEP_0118652816 /NCGR_PEP_ID=MMETSP0785-20121206/11514_1 /TAXON_ID=91992 /ORGANISM="Bolidomonas pacifica, Strain CCMP 1866" /LENGTH=406 /DNA_ID=CAMNT_0006545347 /DNA_START=104 /DNA_END=1320 /DNA_ORIENTATION=+